MGYTVRADPALMGPATTVRVAVMDGDRIVRPGSDDQPTTVPPPVIVGDVDVLWGNGPPPDASDPSADPYESYVDLATGDVYVRDPQ